MIGRRSHDDAQSFEEAWNGRTPRDEHIAALVRFAEDLCESAVAEPTMSFRTSLREQLMAEAATALVPMPATTRRPVVVNDAQPVRRRVATVTAALVASAGVVGIVASSASAVPGDMLYSVKRTAEAVELKIHRDDAARGSFQLAQASERLAEARRLSAEGGSIEHIAETLDDFSASAADGSGSLFTVFTDTGDEQPIRQVNNFAAASSLDLSALSGQLPEGLADSFEGATEAIKNVANEASALCASCMPADVGALVSAVTNLTKPAPLPAKEPTTRASGKPVAPSVSARPPATTAPTTATNPPASSIPALPIETPSLSDLTEPVLDGLLGTDEQVGLIPGLLGGLLGTPR